ncbi:MAG: methyltransferase domain-containing protein [Deltaproteobacteria bacterium]|jgi:2-polyprenyl-3-methyl-5-hydroxy-6-metoxy-1,4-benzoquinol methylase
MFSFPSFAERSTALELMDDPAFQGPELEQTLAEIERINDNLGGYPPSLHGIEALLPPGTKKFSVLDVGCGGADFPMKIADWASSRGLEAEIVGIDLQPTTVDFASRRTRAYDGIRIELANLFDLEPTAPYDIVHAAQVLHHFVGDEAERALAQMARLARWGVVVNDLHRHPLAWGGITVITRALAKSRLVKYDAPLSVLRGFSRDDFVGMCARAGLATPKVTWRPLFRWQVVIPTRG